MARQHRGQAAVPSLWFLRRDRETPAEGWNRLQQWLLRRLLGEQLGRLQVGPAGHRDAGRILTMGTAKGMVFFGPYLGLPSGRYQATLAIEPGALKCGRLVLDVATGGRPLRRETIRVGHSGEMTVNLPFTVPPSRGDVLDKIEIRAWRHTGEAVFAGCRLDELD